MVREQQNFIKKVFSEALEKRSKDLQAPDENCLGKLQKIIERVQYLPTLQNLPLSDVSEEFKQLSDVPGSCDFAIVQLMLVKSTQSASFEPKCHENYLAFLEKINSVSLYEEIIQTTCLISEAILRSANILHPTLNQNVTTSSESKVFPHVVRSLGRFLGEVIVSSKKTLSKNVIDLEDLIVRAYKEGLMTKIIPFVLEVLEPCGRSPTYKSNQWICKIHRLLYEIYMMPNLQRYLHLSIEGLLEKHNFLGEKETSSVLQEKCRNMETTADFELTMNARPLTFGKYDQARDGVFRPFDSILCAEIRHQPLRNSREQLSQEFKFCFTEPRSFFETYPGLVSKIGAVLLDVLQNTGHPLVKHAATVAYESGKAALLLSYQQGRMDESLFTTSYQMAESLAGKYIQDTGKIYLGGWMRYLVGDVLRQHGVSYALQCEVVKGVMDKNIEGILAKLKDYAAKEAKRLVRDQHTLWIPGSHRKLVEEIRNKLEKDVKVDALINFLETVSKNEEEKLAALCEVICSQFNIQKDPPSVCMYKNKMAYLDPLVKGRDGGMRDLLRALVNFCKGSRSFRGLEDLLVDGFLRTGYLSKTVIMDWLEENEDVFEFVDMRTEAQDYVNLL